MGLFFVLNAHLCTLCITTPVLDKCVKLIMEGIFTNKNYRKKKKKCICIKIFANTKIIDFNHVWKSVPLGLHNRNNVDIKIKLIRYDPNCVPCFFFLNSTTCIFAVLYDIYVLDLHWRQSFVYITNVYFKQWPSEFRVIFGIRKCA